MLELALVDPPVLWFHVVPCMVKGLQKQSPGKQRAYNKEAGADLLTTHTLHKVDITNYIHTTHMMIHIHIHTHVCTYSIPLRNTAPDHAGSRHRSHQCTRPHSGGGSTWCWFPRNHTSHILWGTHLEMTFPAAMALSVVESAPAQEQ